MDILHITAHLGGGAGKAIAGIAALGTKLFPDSHRVLLLQEPEKDGYVRECRENGIPVTLWNGDPTPLARADAVVVSWWDHPAMAQFLHELPRAPVPMLLWCHVNGCHYPFLTREMAEAFDAVLFTSPYSLQNPLWTAEERRGIEKKANIVLGMGQFDPARAQPREDCRAQGAFTVGYVGTLNFGKLHPDFTACCAEAAARVPDIRFVMAGDRDRKLEDSVRKAGLAERFTFPGFVSDVPALMRAFDVFGYLLNPSHYGTTENVLLEAMACGVPPVVLRQNVEQYIVPPEESFLVNHPKEYGERMKALWKNPSLRRELGRRARAHVLERYDAEKNAAAFRESCRRAAECSSKAHSFSFLGDTPWQWFLYCLDKENRRRMETAWKELRSGRAAGREAALRLLRACPPILWEKRKGSLRHFAGTFPRDEALQALCELMEDEENGKCKTEL